MPKLICASGMNTKQYRWQAAGLGSEEKPAGIRERRLVGAIRCLALSS